MKEKVHHQKYVELVQKSKALSTQSGVINKKMKEIEEENNFMWEEIKSMSSLMP
jgi:hypothetical protein